MFRIVTTALLVSFFAFGCADDGFDPGDEDGGNPGYDFGGDPNRPICPNTAASIKGTVYAPNGTDPVPGATVFVPSLVPELFPPEVQCEVCGSLGTSYNYWTTVTNYDGTFSLDGVCPGEWTLIMQNGRFRRGLVVKVADNAEINLTADQSRLPRKVAEKGPLDAVPRIAVATGDYDKMECVLKNMGIDDENIDLYEAAAGLTATPPIAPFGGLVQHLEDMKRYNIIFINCTDNTWEKALEDEAVRKNIEAYVTAGGRLYVTDWSYDWIEQVPALSKFIDFEPGPSDEAPETPNAAASGDDGLEIDGVIQDDLMAQWLGLFPNTVTMIAGKPTVPIGHFLTNWVMMHKLGEDTKLWVEGNVSGSAASGVKPLTVTFNFANCGKILYTSYHTEGRDDEIENLQLGIPPKPFPQYCGTKLSPQDRVLEFLIYDIAKCVKPIE